MSHHKPHSHEPEPTAADAQTTAGEPQAQQPAPEAGSVAANVAQLREELKAAKDRELRCHAELDNYRKRVAREMDDQSRYANMSLLRDLLPVLDNVDRAIQAADKTADAATLLDGFKMVHQQVGDVLQRYHCTPIDALLKPFDPHLHHAIMQQPSAEQPANTVLMVTQEGYVLHDRVVRPSQVIVSTKPNNDNP